MSLLQEFFARREGGKDIYSLAECVSMSRSSCKMEYLVGCAPVIYGIPTTLMQP